MVFSMFLTFVRSRLAGKALLMQTMTQMVAMIAILMMMTTMMAFWIYKMLAPKDC